MKKKITDRMRQTGTAAFTLPDLVVALALMAVVSVLLFSGRMNASQKPGLVECKNNLRQIGLAIDLYTRDNGNSLPGPIWLGVYSDYQNTQKDKLGYYLWSYFGLPAPNATQQQIELLKCPASVEAKPASPPINPYTQHISYLTCVAVTNRSPNLEVTNFPFGRPNTPWILPMQATKIKRPSDQWAITDADRLNTGAGSSYYNYIPNPVHNNRPGSSRAGAVGRNYLYFDGSVRFGKTSL